MNRDCCILNAGGGAWAFEPLARQLGDALWVEVSQEPRDFNYLLLADDDVAESVNSFIPLASMKLAADKRESARCFATAKVPTPQTFLLDSLEEAQELLYREGSRQWCLKYPTGCGAAGNGTKQKGSL